VDGMTLFRFGPSTGRRSRAGSVALGDGGLPARRPAPHPHDTWVLYDLGAQVSTFYGAGGCWCSISRRRCAASRRDVVVAGSFRWRVGGTVRADRRDDRAGARYRTSMAWHTRSVHTVAIYGLLFGLLPGLRWTTRRTSGSGGGVRVRVDLGLPSVRDTLTERLWRIAPTPPSWPPSTASFR